MLQLSRGPYHSCSPSCRRHLQRQHVAARQPFRRAAHAPAAPVATATRASLAPAAWQPQPTGHRIHPAVLVRAGRQNAEHDLEVAGSALSRSITVDITQADSLARLHDVVDEWSGSFNFINTSAALVRLSKLQEARSAAAQPLVRRLNALWRQHLPDAGSQQLANVLWAWGRLGSADEQLWDSTLEAFVEAAADAEAASSRPHGVAQECANALWSCARLRRPPTAEQLQLVLQAFVQPSVLQGAAPQGVSNIAWALGELHQLPGWTAGVSSELAQQLLGQEQMELVAYEGIGLAVSTVLVALARLSSGAAPVLSLAFAQGCAQQLVDGVKQRGVGSWTAREAASALWACAALQLADQEFVEAAFAVLGKQLPSANIPEVVQVASACAKLQRRDEALLTRVLQRGQELQQQQQQQQQQRQGGCRTAAGARDLANTANLAAMVPEAVAALDMRQLAADVVRLIAASGIKQQPRVHPPNLQRLYQVHCWLQQHQLLDGRGLTGLLTEQQLQQGAQWQDKRMF